MKQSTEKCPRNIPGAVKKDGNWYNSYGVCLDCNGWNPNCTHNNLIEDGGKTICAMCGLSIK